MTSYQVRVSGCGEKDFLFTRETLSAASSMAERYRSHGYTADVESSDTPPAGPPDLLRRVKDAPFTLWVLDETDKAVEIECHEAMSAAVEALTVYEARGLRVLVVAHGDKIGPRLRSIIRKEAQPNA